MYNNNVASNTNSSSVPTGPQASSINAGNENNQNPTINFIWLYKVNEGIIKKIARGEKIDITDIIPNSFSIIHDTQTNKHSYKSKYFAQTMVSWAINYPNNKVRLIVKPMFASLLSADEIKEVENSFQGLQFYKNRSKKSFFADLYNEKIKNICKNENLRLIDIANVVCEYDKCFNDFAVTVNQNRRHRNFSIVDFNKLADTYCTKDEISKDQNLNFLLNQDSISNGFDLPISIDILRLCINYYGFGYEKNLTLDMDYSFNSLKLLNYENQDIKHKNIRINELSSDIMFPIKRDVHGREFFYENSCVYTSISKHKVLKCLLADPQIFKRLNSHYPLWEKTALYVKSKFSLTDTSEEYLKRKHQNGIFSELLWYIQPIFIDRKSYNQNIKDVVINKTLPICYEKSFWPFCNDYSYKETIYDFLHDINNFDDRDRSFIVGFLKKNDIFIHDDRIFNIVDNMKKNYNNYPTITANASGPNSSIVYNGGTGLNGNNQMNLVLNASGPNSSIVCNGPTGLNGNNQSNRSSHQNNYNNSPSTNFNAFDSVASGTTSQNPSFYQNNHWKSKNDNPNYKGYTGKR